ncbi:hypothetical protein HZB88_02195 [archaeon]|nr:hypothetical protein [archaeon]
MVRQTAYKLWIKDIIQAKQASDEKGIKYFEAKDRQIIRVNLIASIIDKFLGPAYSIITLDDGTGTIRAKVWGDDLWIIENKEVGDVVNILGRLAEFNNEIYIRPEIARKTSLKWALARRLELKKEFGLPTERIEIQAAGPLVEEEIIKPSISTRETIFKIIAESESGIAMSEVIAKSNLKKDVADAIMLELIKEGEIFEYEQGKVRTV